MGVRFRRARVLRVVEESDDFQIVEARVEDEPVPVRAFHDRALFGPLAPGDAVVLNTTARRLGLGTGGLDFVHWVEGRATPDPPPQGHLVKLRYTPLQRQVFVAEEPGHPLRGAYLDAERSGLAGRPVVVLGLHSQLAPAAAGARAGGAGRVAFVHTEAGALPAALSRLLGELRRVGALDVVVTAGHAYGGDLEAVSYPSALLVAVAAGADVILAGPGPGIAGTGTRYGHSAVEQAALADAAAALGGRVVICPRLAAGDARSRHTPLSHHTLTAMELTARSAWIPLPTASPAGEGAVAEGVLSEIRRRLRRGNGAERHALIEVDGGPGLARLRSWGIAVDTMGRGPDDDPLAFLAPAAAGALAARLAAHRPPTWPQPA